MSSCCIYQVSTGATKHMRPLSISLWWRMMINPSSIVIFCYWLDIILSTLSSVAQTQEQDVLNVVKSNDINYSIELHFLIKIVINYYYYPAMLCSPCIIGS